MAGREVAIDFKQLLGACYDTCDLAVLTHDHCDRDEWNDAADWASEKVRELHGEAFDNGTNNLGLALVALLLATVVSDARFNAELEVELGDDTGEGEE